MSLIDLKLSDLNREVEDGVLPAESVDVQDVHVKSEVTIDGRSADSPAVDLRETGTTDSANAVLNEEPDAVTGINDGAPVIDETSSTSSPSPSTTTRVVPPPAPFISTPESQTPSTSMAPFIGPVLGPTSISLYSPYIEDQRVMSPGPNVFEKNIRNAIELRKHEDKSSSDEQGHEKENIDGTSSVVKTDLLPDESVALATPSNSIVLETDILREQTDRSVEEHGEKEKPAEVLPETDSNKEETSVEAHGSLKQADVSHCLNKEQAEILVLEPCDKGQADTSVEAQIDKEKEETMVPTENILEAEQPQEVETETDNSAPETQPADAETIAQAKEWHDSIIRRVARLRGLSCWLGERNKRMDGMVEILVRSLEHMGVGAVTDHIGNLIPLQNFRLNSAIKLSSTDNTWTTCDEEIMSNDINAWLPDSLPDDHNLPLTNEQMGKYESQVEALRAENESLQRSLQTALDNQGSLGVQVNQWQACIDSAGQQLCRVTQQVHESKSRERHLRHLLGEERRIKDSLVQQNSATKAEQQDHTTENVTWQQNNDGMNHPSQSVTSATTENATFVQEGTSQVQHRRGLYYGQRDTGSSRLNSSAPPFISAYSSPHRSNYRGNWNSGSDWHSRSGSGRHFGSAAGRGRHSSGRGYYRKEHSTNAGFNRLLDGFFDNLNRIENALRQQGISVPGPSSDSSQVVQQQQQQQQAVSSNVSMQYPTVQDLQQQQQTVPNQPIYYSPPMQPVVYAEQENAVAQSPVQSIPSMHQVPQSPTVVQAVQPHVQFVQVEEQAY